jgi:hypothetical protein
VLLSLLLVDPQNAAAQLLCKIVGGVIPQSAKDATRILLNMF